MKQTNLLKTLLLLCALVVGSMNGWADATYSLTPDQSSTGSSATSYITTLTEFTYEGVSWKMNQWNPKTLQIKTNQTNSASEFRFYNTSAFTGKIKSVVITFSALTVVDASKLMFKGGTSEVSTTTGGTAGTWNSTAKTLTWTPGESDNFTYFAFYQDGKAASGTNYLASSDAIVVTYEGSVTPTCATPTFSPAAGVYTSAQNVTISTTTEDATIYYTEDGSTPTASSTPYTGAIAVSSTTTIKAIAVKEGNNNSSVASATYTIIEHAGTEADPYTVADARAAIDAGVGVTDVCVRGIVCVGGSNLGSGAMNYWISDDGTETDKFEVYKGKNLNNTNFSAVTDVIVGDQVVVYGNIKKYNSTYEFDQGNYLVSLISLQPSVALDKTAINAPYAGADGTINVVYSNITTVVAEVVFCDENGDDATYNWIAADLNASNNVEYIIDANAGGGRTAYLKVKALDDNSNEVFSDIVTITQAACPYATLPFAFNDGKDDIASAAGMTQDGLGGDYKSAPKLKFDTTGDYLILNFKETPGSLSFDIKGNGSGSDPWDGTFTVQTSADGETYTDLKAYTELGATETESFALASTVRYIKWIYTEKKTGNVAFGNISLKTDGVVPVTISAAGLATFASDSELDFTNVDGIEAYIAKEVSGAIKLEKVNKVPAGAGVLLRSVSGEAKAADVPVTAAAADDVTGNLFVRGNDAAVATGSGPYNYVLGKHNGEVGFYKAGGMTVATDKAYLQTTVASARIAFDFDDNETTGLSEELRMKNEESAAAWYDLQGRKVAQPTKGLYIVNGKKVVIK